MSAHSPGLTAETVQDSLDRLVHSLRNWRIALGAYAVVGALAAGLLSAAAAAIVVFAGFSAIALFVVRLKAEIASLRMHRQFRRIAEMQSSSRDRFCRHKMPPTAGRRAVFVVVWAVR